MTKLMRSSSSHKNHFTAWRIWFLGCLFYFYESILQISPSVMSHELMRDFNVTSQALGILSGIYFWSYAAMQLPAGLLMDYFGPRRILALATLLCAVSTIAFGLTNYLLMACCARLMIGFGSAFAFIGALKFAANWFKMDKFAFVTGLTATLGMLGGVCGEGPLAWLVDQIGWRHSMIFLGISGFILALFILLLTKDAPQSLQMPQRSHEPMQKSLNTLIRNSQLWLVAIYGCLMYMGTPVFCGLWGVPFLMYKMHLTKTIAANYISLIFVGWMLASPLWGIFSYHIGRRKPPMIIASLGTFITSIFFIYGPTTYPTLVQVSLFLFGVFSAAFLPAFAIAKEHCDKRYVATGLGFMNLMNTLGVAIAQPLTGFILDQQWQGALIDQVRVYPLEAYHRALAVLPLGMFIAFLSLIWIRETYCKNRLDN